MKTFSFIAIGLSALLWAAVWFFSQEESKFLAQANQLEPKIQTLRQEIASLPVADAQKNQEAQKSLEMKKSEFSKLCSSLREGAFSSNASEVQAQEASSDSNSARRKNVERAILHSAQQGGIQNVELIDVRNDIPEGTQFLKTAVTPISLRYRIPKSEHWMALSKILAGAGKNSVFQLQKIYLRPFSLQEKNSLLVDLEIFGILPKIGKD